MPEAEEEFHLDTSTDDDDSDEGDLEVTAAEETDEESS